MKMSSGKYLIVGQGLAGTILACRLFQEGMDVEIVDDPRLSSSSRIAGGIINPVVLKRLTLSENTPEMLQAAEEFYRWCAQEFGRPFFIPRRMVKIFGDERDRKFWMEKSTHDLNPYLEVPGAPANLLPCIPSPHGHARVLVSGIVALRELIECAGSLWEKEGRLRKETFRHEEIVLHENSVVWKGQAYAGVIFCEGYKGLQNPWFGEAGFAPVKGEILTVEIPGLGLEEVLNKGVYVIPQGNDIYKVGATFSWHVFNDEPEERAREELIEKLRAVVKCEFTILKQEAGVRPAAVGRMPIIGTHPQQKRLHIFNGMGTKGALLAPFYTKLFREYLQGKCSLPKQIDVKRFFP